MVLETLVSNSKRFCKLREHAHGACKVYTAALQHAHGTRVLLPPPMFFKDWRAQVVENIFLKFLTFFTKQLMRNSHFNNREI